MIAGGKGRWWKWKIQINRAREGGGEGQSGGKEMARKCPCHRAKGVDFYVIPN